MARRAAKGLPLFDGRDARGPGEDDLPRGVTRHRGGYRARAFPSGDGRELALGCSASPGVAREEISRERWARRLAEADAALEAAGWDVEDEMGCECEGGGCECG